ncbi:MAG: hypothetical protein KJ886_04855 [Candidatus Thermoplasmatota archaeon]|nr:hypothetical protein [Candidatus Thermoplasmatota archaeon]
MVLSDKIVWQENNFPKEIEKSNKRYMIYMPPIIFFVVFGVSMLIQIVDPSPVFPFVGLGVACIGSFSVFLTQYIGNRSLPKKVGITEEGFYYVDKGGRENFIRWMDIISIQRSYYDIVYQLQYYKKGGRTTLIPLGLIKSIALDLKNWWENYLKEVEKKTILRLKENETG